MSGAAQACSRATWTFAVRVVLALVLAATLHGRAAAQSIAPEPPGPYVIDVRGTMAGVPKSPSYYPGVPVGTTVPARGFGGEIGAHVYLRRFGPARLGIGVNVSEVRGTSTTPPASTTSTDTSGSSPSTAEGTVFPNTSARQVLLAPQLSFNFGTRDGWSYLSAGYGAMRVKTDATASGFAPVHSSQQHGALNLGGGARWFLNSHLGVGFDLRFFRIPGATLVVLDAGFSVR